MQHEKLTQLCETITRANPAIKALQFGCHLKFQSSEIISSIITVTEIGERFGTIDYLNEVGNNVKYWVNSKHLKSEIVKIIGRPINLNDVKIAYKKLYSDILHWPEKFTEVAKLWDGENDLTKQSNEVVELISGDLLKEARI